AWADATRAAGRNSGVLRPDSDWALGWEATGTLRARLSLAAVAGAYQATGTESLALLHEYPPQETTLAVLLDVPRRLPRRFELAALAAALALPGQDGLRQLSLTGEGALSLDLSARSRGSDVAIRTVAGIGRRRRIQRTLSAGGALSVELEQRAWRQRRVFRDAGGALVLQSRRRAERRRELS